MTRVHELLPARGWALSCQPVPRFVTKRKWHGFCRPTVRMDDTPPREVAAADFRWLGWIPNPEMGKRGGVWAMPIVLCHSRHSFPWPMPSSTSPEVIGGLGAVRPFLGAMSKCLVIDNFPAAVMGWVQPHPRLICGFLEYAQHRGLFADPTRAGHPKDKPNVERSIT